MHKRFPRLREVVQEAAPEAVAVPEVLQTAQAVRVRKERQEALQEVLREAVPQAAPEAVAVREAVQAALR